MVRSVLSRAIPDRKRGHWRRAWLILCRTSDFSLHPSGAAILINRSAATRPNWNPSAPGIDLALSRAVSGPKGADFAGETGLPDALISDESAGHGYSQAMRLFASDAARLAEKSVAWETQAVLSATYRRNAAQTAESRPNVSGAP